LTVIGLTVDIIKERNDGELQGIILVTVTWNRNKISENLTLDFITLISAEAYKNLKLLFKMRVGRNI